MHTNRLALVLRYLLRRAVPAAPGEVSDAELLARFARQRDEAAFELLVWRHGPMVLSLCQRLLRHEQDAEDAFQATFLVLVRKAGSISKREALASWLYKVAYRIACRARSRAPVPCHQAERMPDLPAADDQSEVIWREVRSLLDEEVARLPEAYRRAVVLCYLEGKTNAEAARLLGWPLGTVASRLTRARDRLRAALQRRGCTVASATLVAVLAEKAVAATLPAELVRTTLGAAVAYTSGQAAAGVLSTKAVALTEGALRIMWYGKMKMLAAILVSVLLLGAGAGVVVRHASAGAEPDPAEAAAVEPAAPAVQ